MQLIGIQIYNLDIARIKNQRNNIQVLQNSFYELRGCRSQEWAIGDREHEVGNSILK